MAPLVWALSAVAGATTQAPGAPAISSLTAGDGFLAVSWTAPGSTGGSPIKAYDLRHITSSASDKSDTHWTVVDDVWTSGSLEYTLTGLIGATAHDVQMRAVNTNDTEGAWSATVAGTPTVGAAVIASATAGDTALTIVWNAPAGVAAASITAYDLRYRLAVSSTNSAAADGSEPATATGGEPATGWSEVTDIWTSGTAGRLEYILTGLTNTTGYEVQVRAVTAVGGDGAWSATATGTPADHGDTAATATAVTSGVPLGGEMQSGTDADYFRIQLSGTAGIVVYTSGDIDTFGTLLDGSETTIVNNDDSGYGAGGKNFFIWSTQPAGTYYVKVTGKGGATGSYALHAHAIPDPTGIADAQPVVLGETVHGVIVGRGDLDYYKLVLPTAADVIVRASGAVRDMLGEIIRPDDTVAASNENGFILPGETDFLIRKLLPAGTYYITVKERYNKSDRFVDEGAYALIVQRVSEPGDTTAAAVRLALGDIAGGNIGSADDVDYFRVDVGESTDVVVRAVGYTVDIDGALLDSDSNPVQQADVYEETFSRSAGLRGFTIRHTLPAGSHYVRVSRPDSDPDAAARGGYTIRVLDAAAAPEKSYPGILNGWYCEDTDTTVEDPLYVCQWALKNSGQYEGSPAGEDINVEGVWADGNLGGGVAVAVVDDGLEVTHEDLRENVDEARSRNYLGSGFGLMNPSFAMHGTSVAGIIASRDNTRGGRGVAPRTTLYGYNVLRASTPVNIADVMTRNLDSTAVSNNSWGNEDGLGFTTAGPGWHRSVDLGVTEGFGGKGIFYSWAGGNGHTRGDNVNYDEYNNYYAVASICGVDSRGKRYFASETGAALWVCAPAAGAPRARDTPSNPIDIVTTRTYNEYIQNFEATSAAAPMASGVVALVRNAHPSLTWRDVKLILAGSARKNDPDGPGWETGALQYGSTTDRYDFNYEYGFGVVDAEAAVDLAGDWTTLPRFVSESRTAADTDIAVPDTNTPVTSTVTMGTKVQFTEYVELNITFTAPGSNVRHIDIDLTSPSSVISRIADKCEPGKHRQCTQQLGSDDSIPFKLGSSKHLGEDPAGVWTLKLADAVTGGQFSGVESWNLKVYGHRSTPGAPVDACTALVSSGKAAVFWSEPANAGASAVTAYDVRHIAGDASDKSDSEWTVIDSAADAQTRRYTVSGLTDGTLYDMQVRAVNAAGDGVWSDTVTAAPAAGSNGSACFLKGATTVRSAEENTAAGQAIGTVVGAANADDDTLTYTLGGADAAHFSIVASTGQLSTKGALNYESKSSYRVTVSVSDLKDGNGNPDTAADDVITVEISVGDVEEAGAVRLSSGSPRIGTALTASLSDPDGGVTGTAWSWARSTDKTAWTNITGAASAVYTPVAADRGSHLRASAVYTDARGPGRTAQAVTNNAVAAQPLSPPPSHSPVFTPPPPAPPPPAPLHAFSDLEESGVHEPAVRALAEEGMLTDTGCAATRLCPSEALRRWEAAVWLTRILDGEEPTGTPIGHFADIDTREWWATHVERLAELKVTLGCSLNPTRFCPDGRVTRAQMASFLERAFELPAAEQSAGFGDTDGNVHETAIDALHAARITKGCRTSPLHYCPRRHTTRAQMASFLNRARTH